MKALTRNTLLAVPLALVIYAVLPKHDTLAWDLLDAFTLAFCFAYVGYLVETLLLKIPGIETSGGKIVRVLGWFAGGLWCYVLGRWALHAYGRDTSELPSLLWGGLLFVGLQFVLHGMLQASGKPNFYSGQLQEANVQ
ncbi:MAG TPA: hypothetical protein VGQ48_05465 [Gemmatimonadales bacterium]|jgi:hypothetical protein|nr:hypothetical protein [Gemmatimonadales bacterium]